MRSSREWLVVREDVIKTHVPHKTQELSFSCGASALRSVLHYFRIKKTEEEVRKIAKTEDYGTMTQNLIRAAKKFGLETRAKYNMDKQDIINWLNKGKPVIVCFQAWGSKKKYKKRESGHYAVAIGYDKNNIYFQDPAISEVRGHLSWKEFVNRWYDIDCDQYGIAMWKKGVRKEKEIIKKSKKIK